MAKKYKFKLEALLKLRSFAEEKAKIELGKVNQKINVVMDAIATHERSIEVAYNDMEEAFKTATLGNFAQGYPRYIESQKQAILNCEKQLVVLEQEKQKRLEDLQKARAELKVMDKLKEKNHTTWKKAYNKEMDQKIEENVQLWLLNKEKSA
jgi:flagellar FliJ protein